MTTQTSAPLVHQNLTETLSPASELAKRVDRDLDLNPPYQRGKVWTTAQQVGLVKSWLLGLPVPAIVLNDRTFWPETRERMEQGRLHFAVIDGQQRLRAAHAWFTGELTVPASWFDAEHVTQTEDSDDGPLTRFTWLTHVAQARMELRSPLTTLSAHVATVAQEAEIYLLVNGAGVNQTPEDLARAAAIAQGAVPQQ